MGETENKEIVRRAFDAWAAGRRGVFDLLAPDATWTIVGRSAAAGSYSRDQFMERVHGPFNARLKTKMQPVVHALYAEGDMVIAYFSASATALDGSTYDNTYTWYLRLRDGAVVEAIAFFDSIEFDDFWNRVEPASPT